MHNVVYRADYGRCCRTVLVAVGMTLRFFCYLFERRSSGFTHGEKSIGKKKGWRSCLPGLPSPAHTTTRRCPHGVYKHRRNDRLGQSLFTAARRPWTLFIARRRSASAFFCALVARCTSELVARFRACRSVSPGARGQPTPALQSKAGRTMRGSPWLRGGRGGAWWLGVVPRRA
jgi:hypothetical protein